MNWDTSFLDFQFAYTDQANATYSLGIGSALNFIESITFTSRPGVEISRITQFNLWAAQYLNVGKSRCWKDSVGSGFFLNNTNTNESKLNQDTAYQACIPMSALGGVFSGTQLCPPQICSGMRIELLLSTNAKQCVVTSAGPHADATFQISLAKVSLDSFLLSDASLRSLESTSAKNGLD